MQAWLDGTVTNHGLFFPDLGNAVAGTEEASGDYVKWTLDAQIVGVPEPSTLALAALGLLGLLGLIGFGRRKR